MGLKQWLTDAWSGKELSLPATRALSEAPEQRLYAYPYGYPAVALKYGMLIHGPGATELLSGAHGADGNSAVFACLMALSTAFFEAPLRIFKVDGEGGRDPLPDHPMQDLLDSPNPAMNQQEVGFWVSWALHTDGNAYLRKVRSGDAVRGNVLELWPLSPRVLEPMTVRPTDFISFYRRDRGNGRYEDIPTENIVHLKLGVDERDQRKGISPIKRLIRHVGGDDEASNFAGALLRNFAVPGTVMTVPEGVTITKEKADELRDRLSQAYGGDRRGATAVLTNGADLKRMGFSPEELNLKTLHQIPETRICAVMRVPPAVAGLSVGLEQTSNYASFREVREMFAEQTLVPLWSLVAAKINQQLTPDFSADRNVRVEFDLSDVRALQEDENARWTRVLSAVEKGVLDPNEARAEFGYKPREQPAPVALRPVVNDDEEEEDEDAGAAAGGVRGLSLREVERVVPAGAGEPLEVLPLAPDLTQSRMRRLARLWDREMGSQWGGLLDAEVVNG